jgi:hypothetical protein
MIGNEGRSRVSALPERLGYTVMFLRMTATEMHKLAEQNPEIARELRHMAEQVQGEADSLVGHIGERRQ